MNLKITIGLLSVAVAIGIVALINPFKSEEERVDKSPWFYQIAQEDIRVIEVTHLGSHVRFVKTGKAWAFEEPASLVGFPPAWELFQGTELILSGPRTQRDLTIAAATIDDPTQYGLDDPNTIVDVELTSDRHLRFKLGDETTSGDHYYGEVVGFPQLYLVVKIWGDVVSRLARELPLPAWYVERDIDTLLAASVFRSDLEPEEGQAVLEFLQFEGAWFVRDFRTAQSVPERRPVDPERWEQIVPLLKGSPNISVENIRVEDEDYTRWGIDEEGSSVIEVRYPGVSDRGNDFIDSMSLLIGDKTPDGTGYYALWKSNQFFRPTIIVDAQWVETFFGLFDDPP
jgi:hypothetical protein